VDEEAIARVLAPAAAPDGVTIEVGRAPLADGALAAQAAALVGALPLHTVLAMGGPGEAVAALVAAFPEALGVWFGAAPGEDPRAPPPADAFKLPRWLAEGVGQGGPGQDRRGESGGGVGERAPVRPRVSRCVSSFSSGGHCGVDCFGW
jgi:hypothetical protein